MRLSAELKARLFSCFGCLSSAPRCLANKRGQRTWPVLSLLTGMVLTAPAASAQCKVWITRSVPISLAAGVNVTVDVSALASGDGGTAIFGTPTSVWPASGARSLYRSDKRYFGVASSSSGVRLIESPVDDSTARDPRAVHDGQRGWHVLFVTGVEGGVGGPLMVDSASLWYAHFAAGRWTHIHRIARVRGAALNPTMTSALVGWRDKTAFAFGYDLSTERKSNAPGNQGLVILRGAAESWQQDTLKTWAMPRTVSLLRFGRERLSAVYSQEYFENHRAYGSALFYVSLTPSLGVPKRLVDATERHVSYSYASNVIDDVALVSWVSVGQRSDGDSANVAFLNAHGALTRPFSVSGVASNDRPLPLLARDGRGILFARAGTSRSDVLAIVVDSSHILAMQSLRVPFENFVLRGIAGGSRSFDLITGALSVEGNGASPSSIETRVATDCSARR